MINPLKSLPIPQPADVSALTARWGTLALNQLLKQQVWAADLLAVHGGKAFKISWFGVELSCLIGPAGRLGPALSNREPDVLIQIADELPSLSRLRNPAPMGSAPLDVRVSGDAALAQTLSTLARDLRPDIEDALSDRIGDLLAARLVRTGQGVAKAVSASVENAKQNLLEYLVYEKPMLVDQAALVPLSETAAQLKSALDRLERQGLALEQRVDRLMNRNGSAAS